MDILITPPGAWRPLQRPVPTRAPDLASNQSRTDDWADCAFKEQWQDAVLGLLRQRWRQAVPYWEVVNVVALESAQETRCEHRVATRAILKAIKQLTHDRRILRYRRRYLTVLDLGREIITIEAHRALKLRSSPGA